MNESFVTIVGNMIGDPVLRTSKHGKHFATFRVASTTRRRDPASGAYVDGGTNYLSVIVFNGLAANVSASLRKGEPVIVYGRLRVNQWVGSQNQHMTSVEVEGYSVGHDLSWGQARFAKGGRARYDAGARPGNAPGADPPAGLDPPGAAAVPAGMEVAPGYDRAGHPSGSPGTEAAPRLDPPEGTSDSGRTRHNGDSPRREPGGFDRSVQDAETDPYEVVTSG